MLLQMGILLTCARVLGEVARRFNQPSVVGEILAGILLGPTLLGSLAAHWNGMGPRESLAIGSGMTAQGTMGIILGLLALRNGIIEERSCWL